MFAQVENEHDEDENSNMADRRFGTGQKKIQLSPEGCPGRDALFPYAEPFFFLSIHIYIYVKIKKNIYIKRFFSRVQRSARCQGTWGEWGGGGAGEKTVLSLRRTRRFSMFHGKPRHRGGSFRNVSQRFFRPHDFDAAKQSCAATRATYTQTLVVDKTRVSRILRCRL